MLLHGLRCYTLYFIIFAICATVPLSGAADVVDLTSNEEPIKYEKESKMSQNSNLQKVRATLGPNQGHRQIMKTMGEADTDVDKTEESMEKEEELPQSNPEETKPSADENFKKDFGTIDLSKNTADKFVHIANMTALSGFNYSPSELAKFKIWSNGVVPFFIDEFSFDKILRDKIRIYLDSTNSLTGLRFMEIPKPPDDDRARWIFFVNRRGQLDCTDYSHESFTDTGVQKVILGYNCFNGGRAMAALVLAIAGVPPQHNSPDREEYIEVSMKSIQPDKTSLFKTVSPHQWIFYDIKYDFNSAGHYSSHKYTVDGTATITARNNKNEPVGESEGFSLSDIKKIRMLYNYVVSENNKNLKRPDCQTLYRSGVNLKHQKIVKPQKLARKKPKKYVEAAKNIGETILDGKDGKDEEKNPDPKPELKPEPKPEPKTDPNKTDEKPDPNMTDGKPDPNMTDEKPDPNKTDEKPDPNMTDGKPDPNMTDEKPDPIITNENKKEEKEIEVKNIESSIEKEIALIDAGNMDTLSEDDEGEEENLKDKDNPRQKLKKKKRFSEIDPLKWDDIKTDESA